MKLASAAAALLLLAAPAFADNVKSDIDKANAKFVAAFNKGDGAAIAALYTENATALPAGAASRSWSTAGASRSQASRRIGPNCSIVLSVAVLTSVSRLTSLSGLKSRAGSRAYGSVTVSRSKRVSGCWPSRP